MPTYDYQNQSDVFAALDQTDYRVWFVNADGGPEQWYHVQGMGKREANGNRIVTLGYDGAQRDWEMTARHLQGLVDTGAYTCLLEVPECNHDGNPDDPCEGKVRWIMSDSGTNAWPYCEKHALAREAVLARAREYQSPVAPSWFDPLYAGESWDED